MFKVFRINRPIPAVNTIAKGVRPHRLPSASSHRRGRRLLCWTKSAVLPRQSPRLACGWVLGSRGRHEGGRDFPQSARRRPQGAAQGRGGFPPASLEPTAPASRLVMPSTTADECIRAEKSGRRVTRSESHESISEATHNFPPLNILDVRDHVAYFCAVPYGGCTTAMSRRHAGSCRPFAYPSHARGGAFPVRPCCRQHLLPNQRRRVDVARLPQ